MKKAKPKKVTLLRFWRSMRATMKRNGKDPSGISPEDEDQLVAAILWDTIPTFTPRGLDAFLPCPKCGKRPSVTFDGPMLIDNDAYRQWVVVAKCFHICYPGGIAEVFEPTSAIKFHRSAARLAEEWNKELLQDPGDSPA